MVKKIWIGIIVVFICAIIAFVYTKAAGGTKTRTYAATDEYLHNPMMGFAPNADYIEAVGDNTLVYVEITWRKLEPEEGKFDFSAIEEENNLDRWRKEGKKAVIRFVCDVPSDEEHMDIPDWLYDKTGDGTFYDTAYGKGYSPDYGNEQLIAYHRKAIEALGQQYGGDHFVCFVELGSVGHWGEWHVKYDEGIQRLPSEDVLEQYVTPYVDAFPNASLLMRRPFSYVDAYGMGVYNDMTGEKEDTEEWLDWIKYGGSYRGPESPMKYTPVPDIWNHAPVGGEFTSGITMEEMLVTAQKRTLKLLEQSHMTFIGPKCPIACDEEKEYPKETAAIGKMLGYRYRVSESTISRTKKTGQVKISITMENDGVAPMYQEWPVCIYQMDADGKVRKRIETDISLPELYGGKSVTTQITVDDAGQTAKDGDAPVFAVGIEDPDTGKPAVKLDMDCKNQDMYYDLN